MLQPSDEHIRAQYYKRERAFLHDCNKDKEDAREGLERERSFMVEWNRLSTNRIWAKDPGQPVVLFQDSVKEYKHPKHNVWPWGRNVHDLGIFAQVWDYFRFMWTHTKPYAVTLIIATITIYTPIRTFLLGYTANEIVKDPGGVPLWLYMTPFFLNSAHSFLYWWYEMWVPFNSQRYQLRCVLLTQRVQIPDSHPLARRWTAGRFDGLLKDVDELVNGVWKGCLQIVEMIVTVFWILTLCMLNLAVDFQKRESKQTTSGTSYAAYVIVFLILGILVLCVPLLWFRLFMGKLSECEAMVQEGQALYLSAAANSVVDLDMTSEEREKRRRSIASQSSINDPKEELMSSTGRKAFKVFAFTTFRSFFYRLAWTTNYQLMIDLWGPFVAYGLLTQAQFGNQSLTSTIIILDSLTELTKISKQILSLLTVMAKGCLVMGNVSEILNLDLDGLDEKDSDQSASTPTPGGDEETATTDMPIEANLSIVMEADVAKLD